MEQLQAKQGALSSDRIGGRSAGMARRICIHMDIGQDRSDQTKKTQNDQQTVRY